MYTFWTRYGFLSEEATMLTEMFKICTVQELLKLNDDVLKFKISQVRIPVRQQVYAVNAVRSQRNHPHVPPSPNIIAAVSLPRRRNYADSFYQTHKLYQAVGIYQDATTEQVHAALRKLPGLMATLRLRHNKEIEDINKIYAQATPVLTNVLLKKAYDNQSDAQLPIPRQQPATFRTPPQHRAPSPRTHVQDEPVFTPPRTAPPEHLLRQHKISRW